MKRSTRYFRTIFCKSCCFNKLNHFIQNKHTYIVSNQVSCHFTTKQNNNIQFRSKLINTHFNTYKRFNTITSHHYHLQALRLGDVTRLIPSSFFRCFFPGSNLLCMWCTFSSNSLDLFFNKSDFVGMGNGFAVCLPSLSPFNIYIYIYKSINL